MARAHDPDRVGCLSPYRLSSISRYVALIVVAVLAVVIVVNELRVDGVIGRWRRRFAVLADSPIGARHDGGLAWGDVLSVPLPQRPGLLLELVVGRLVEGGRLRAARGLTVGELTRMARLPGEEDRDRLAELARTAERVRFSNIAVSDADIAAAVEGGRVLLERIGTGGREGRDAGGREEAAVGAALAVRARVYERASHYSFVCAWGAGLCFWPCSYMGTMSLTGGVECPVRRPRSGAVTVITGRWCGSMRSTSKQCRFEIASISGLAAPHCLPQETFSL